MTRIRQDFSLFVGEDKILNYTIYNAAGASVLMDGMTAQWVLQDDMGGGNVLEYWTGGSGVVLSGSQAIVTISASDTAGCSLGGIYYSELSACDLSGYRSVLATGTGQLFEGKGG